jgi:hypothetical protein
MWETHNSRQWRSNSRPIASQVSSLTTPSISHLCVYEIFFLLELSSSDFKLSIWYHKQIQMKKFATTTYRYRRYLQLWFWSFPFVPFENFESQMWEIQTLFFLDKWYKMKILSTIKLYNSSSTTLVLVVYPSELFEKKLLCYPFLETPLQIDF